MESLIPILAAVAALIVGVIIVMLVIGRSKGGDGLNGMAGKGSKGRDALLKAANKKLSQNPRDAEALAAVGNIYFQEETWDRAMKTYEILIGIGGAGVNEFEANLRYAISAQKLGMTEEAYKGFNLARTFQADNFEVNYNLGAMEFDRKNYDKTVQFLSQAMKSDPEHPPTLRLLGHALFRLKKPKEAMSFIRKAIDLAPDDKESLYTLGECYYEANQTEQALRIFGHLRADPAMGPNACLYSGNINLEQRQIDKAIQDFEIGLKHQNVKQETLTEIRYKLATCYIQQNDIGKALPLLKQIRLENSNYKDVSVLIGRYQELNSNQNLQVYIMAPSADFVALCRKIVMNYFPRAKIKITNISVNKNEWADILTEVDTLKWQDVIMFRFIRSQGSIGELIVRDFHSHLKDVKAGRGVCITVGKYTEEAKRYTEARLIELIEKDKLMGLLKSLDTKQPDKK
ncbi:MAG: tetratricopeptide repeat protein [Treponema sp.]|jgi:tetratricopeptide (TPR) repeat protein|nr:tetratricopeptide repeat protein [Treponema sp.]